MEHESKPELLEEKTPKKIFLDLGSGRNPILGRGTRELEEDEMYIALDNDLEELSIGQKRIEKRIEESNKNIKNAKSVAGDVYSLPFKDASLEEVYVGNVFGEPYQKKGGWVEHRHKNQKEIDSIIFEISRVLKNGGRVTILEDNTPDFNNERMYLIKALQKAGLNLEANLGDDHPNFNKEYEKYTRSKDLIFKGRSYIIIAKKS